MQQPLLFSINWEALVTWQRADITSLTQMILVPSNGVFLPENAATNIGSSLLIDSTGIGSSPLTEQQSRNATVNPKKLPFLLLAKSGDFSG